MAVSEEREVLLIVRVLRVVFGERPLELPVRVGSLRHGLPVL